MSAATEQRRSLKPTCDGLMLLNPGLSKPCPPEWRRVEAHGQLGQEVRPEGLWAAERQALQQRPVSRWVTGPAWVVNKP